MNMSLYLFVFFDVHLYTHLLESMLHLFNLGQIILTLIYYSEIIKTFLLIIIQLNYLNFQFKMQITLIPRLMFYRSYPSV